METISTASGLLSGIEAHRVETLAIEVGQTTLQQPAPNESGIETPMSAQTGREDPDPGKLDRLGATASLACAIHCALLPFVVTILPVYGLSFLAGETVEWVLVAIALTLAAVSLLRGYRQHRSVRVLAMLSAAVVLLIAGRLTHHQAGGHHGDGLLGSAIFAVIGGLLLVGAHLINYRLCKSCQSCTGGCSSAG